MRHDAFGIKQRWVELHARLLQQMFSFAHCFHLSIYSSYLPFTKKVSNVEVTVISMYDTAYLPCSTAFIKASPIFFESNGAP